MSFVIANATLLDLDPLHVEAGELRIDGGIIVERGQRVTRNAQDEVIDCRGAVVMPGLVNGHTHLYSALAVGMPPPPKTPRNFKEILELVWWRLDCALDAQSIETSARVGALAAAECGATTLIDHHASPNCIDGSLDLVETGIRSVGLRGILCYETTDRHGANGRHTGIEENRRYLKECHARRDGMFAGLVGAHASFTLDDDTLEQLVGLADSLDAGIHIHVAEDGCDEEDAKSRGFSSLIARLDGAGVLRPASVLAHCTHLSDDDTALLTERGVTTAHNARSNMNNAVGYARPKRFSPPPMLGTDGIGGDLFAELKAAWYVSQHEHGGLSPNELVAMLNRSARRASQSLGVTLGKLETGAAADVVLTDYRPATVLDTGNAAAHLIFGMQSRAVTDVMVAGEWLVRDRKAVQVDADAVRRDAVQVASELWLRMVE